MYDVQSVQFGVYDCAALVQRVVAANVRAVCQGGRGSRLDDRQRRPRRLRHHTQRRLPPAETGQVAL